MPAILGQINKILSHSFVDGPGNRCVIFLQGCNLACLYCHNPYTIHFCNHCGRCVADCPTGALEKRGDVVVWQADLCVEWDHCIQVCPHGSSPRVIRMTPEETWQQIQPYAPFISGVTLTGGEPTLQPVFLQQFLKLIKQVSNLNTCIETNGQTTEAVLGKLIPFLDYAMVDLKVFDPVLHQRLTGADNAQTLNTIRILAEAGTLHMVRTTIVPGFTDTFENAKATARFLAEIDPNIHWRLLRFRPHGVVGLAKDWASPDDALMDRLVALAKAQGLNNVDRSI